MTGYPSVPCHFKYLYHLGLHLPAAVPSSEVGLSCLPLTPFLYLSELVVPLPSSGESLFSYSDKKLSRAPQLLNSSSVSEANLLRKAEDTDYHTI